MGADRHVELQEEFVEVRFVVEPNYAGWRLDRYLCQKIPRLSRTRVQAIIRRSLSAERPLKPSTLIRPGLTFSLRRRASQEPPTPTQVETLYVDDALVVVDKPAGLPIHPTARYHRGTLTAWLRQRFGADGGFGAHPAHRLDRETSGLLVCGRSPAVCRALMHSFVSHQVRKEYLAIVEGHPPEDTFTVDAPIAEGTELIRIAVRIDSTHGKPAQSRFGVLRRFTRAGEPFALVCCAPQTGRQHQLRIHLQRAGFPLVGDKMYGPDAGYFDRFSRGRLEPEAWERLRLPRQALHAARLELPHPVSGQPLALEAPLPADLTAFLEGAEVLPRQARSCT